MIIGSDRELRVGAIVDDGGGIYDGDGCPQVVPIYVVRRSTREEWLAYVREVTGREPFDPSRDGFFYEISVD
jgi:hypothetical protein